MKFGQILVYPTTNISYVNGSMLEFPFYETPYTSPRNQLKDFRNILPLLIYINWWVAVQKTYSKMNFVSCTNVLILIMTSQILQIMGSPKIQILEYLKNGTQHFNETKKFLTCASDGTFNIEKIHNFTFSFTKMSLSCSYYVVGELF